MLCRVSEPEIKAFRSHPRSWEQNLYVYPVLSRRARGLSIGVNLSPHKACNMDCVYCQVDRTVPATVKTVDLGVVREELTALLARAVSGEIFTHEPFASAPEHLKRLADVAFSGDGEPTSFRGFLEACRIAVGAKQAAGAADLPIRVITNAIDLDRPEVIDALALLDSHHGEVWAKLDAGTEEYFAEVARTKITLGKVVKNIHATARIRPVVIQALFMKLGGEGPGEEEIEAWLGRLAQIGGRGRISLVQVYTVARPPAESRVAPLPREELERIAHLTRDRVGIPAGVF